MMKDSLLCLDVGFKHCQKRCGDIVGLISDIASSLQLAVTCIIIAVGMVGIKLAQRTLTNAVLKTTHETIYETTYHGKSILEEMLC